MARSDVLLQLARLLMLAQRPQIEGEVAGRDQGVGVVLPEHPALMGEGVLVELAGCGVLAQSMIQSREPGSSTASARPAMPPATRAGSLPPRRHSQLWPQISNRYELARAHTHHAAGDLDQASPHWHEALALYTDLALILLSDGGRRVR